MYLAVLKGLEFMLLLQATRAAKAAAAAPPTRAATPSARVKPEPGPAAAAAALGSAAPSTKARSREPDTSKRTGGGRDGYAVRQSVLDDDWEEEVEDETDQLSKHATHLQHPLPSIYTYEYPRHRVLGNQCICTLTAVHLQMPFTAFVCFKGPVCLKQQSTSIIKNSVSTSYIAMFFPSIAGRFIVWCLATRAQA